MRVLPESRRLDAVENSHEERDVAIDEIEARLIRLAPQSRRDEKDFAVRRAIIIARINFLIATKRAAVQQVERFALRHVFVGIEDLDFSDESATLQRERRARTDAATPANDRYLHSALLELGKNLIRDCLHSLLGFFVITNGGLLRIRHRASHAWTPIAVVAKLGFLQPVPRVRNAEALFDLQQILKMRRRHCLRWNAKLRAHKNRPA